MTSAFVQAGRSGWLHVVFVCDPAQCPGHTGRRAAGTAAAGGQLFSILLGEVKVKKGLCCCT